MSDLIDREHVIDFLKLTRDSEYEKSTSAEVKHKSVIRSKHDAHVAFCDYLIECVKQLPTHPTPSNTLGALDCIERRLVSYKLTDLVNEFEEILSHIREREENDSVCGLCEYDGAYMGQSGDWCNECPGFDKADCFKLKDKYKKEWLELMNTLPSVQPERKKGKWIYGEHESAMCDGYRCDKCGFFVPWDYQHKFIDFIKDYNYCPSCGAKMEVKND